MTAPPLSWHDIARLPPAAAAAIFVERAERDDCPDDSGLLDKWLAQNEENRAAWTRMRDVWDMFEGMADDPGLAEIRSIALTLRPRHWLAYAAAASVALALGSAVFLKMHLPGSAKPAAQTASASKKQDFASGDSIATVVLPDGSRMTLDKHSSADIAFTKQARLVHLERGQASFDVLHDPASMFRVAASGRIITDLGTLFSVSVRPAGVSIALLRGEVSIAKGFDPAVPGSVNAVRLRPGEQLVASTGAPDRIVQVDLARILAWQQVMLSYDNRRLAEVVTDMNAAGQDQLIISDPQVAELRISGSFRTGDNGHFAQTLSALYPVRVERAGPHLLRLVHTLQR